MLQAMIKHFKDADKTQTHAQTQKSSSIGNQG